MYRKIFSLIIKMKSEIRKLGVNYSDTVVVKNINIIKTTFDFNFDFYHANSNSYARHKHGNKKKLLINSFSLFTCKLVI